MVTFNITEYSFNISSEILLLDKLLSICIIAKLVNRFYAIEILSPLYILRVMENERLSIIV